MSPPNENGIMDLTSQQKTDITNALNDIKNNFSPSDEFSKPTIFYFVSEYNKLYPSLPINGDTAESLGF